MKISKISMPITALLLLGSIAAACASAQRAPDEEPPRIKVATGDVPESERWRDRMPEAGEAPDLVVPAYEEATLDNGLRVIVSRQADMPLVSLNVAFLKGSASDPAGKSGLAGIAYGLLLEGAGDLDAMGLADAFADLGTSPYRTVYRDGAQVGVRVLSRNSSPALDLLADMVRRPSFDEADLDRKQREVIANLEQRLGQPRWLAGVALSALVFGEEHPYGRPHSGTPETVASLTLEDVKDFHRAAFVPRHAAFIVAGDVDLDTAVTWAKKHFGDWESDSDAQPLAPPDPDIAERDQVAVIERPGLQQTTINLGRPGLAVGDEDELALMLASRIFGGMFGSRLNQNLREDKGYTYGARSSVPRRRGKGMLSASTSVEARVTGAALSEIFAEIRGLTERPITEVELHAAREGLIRSLTGRFETVEGIASTASALFLRGRPLDHYESLVDALEAVTLEEVRGAATTYFDPATMQLVLVGDPGVIDEQVPPLGLGELVRREIRERTAQADR